MSDRRVTMTDIALLSDASPTTVSLVLRDKPGISLETRDRVLAAAHSLGYRRRSSRRPVEAHAVRNIALLIRARTRQVTDRPPGVNPFYSWVVTGIEAQARMHRMNLLYATLPVDDRNNITDVPDYLLSQPLDGALIVGPFSDQSIATVLGGNDATVILVDAPAMPRRYDVIASDNEVGGYLAVQHLIEHGHREIGLISPHAGTDPNFRQRTDGYLRAMREANLQPRHGLIVADDVAAAVATLIKRHPDLTAMFCVNDSFAVGAIKAAAAVGRPVPGLMSIVGFDDTDHASHSGPGLTTMAVDKIGMGRLAIQMLDYRLAWPEAAIACTTLTPRLVARESVSSRKES